jgi:hypothetical protein
MHSLCNFGFALWRVARKSVCHRNINSGVLPPIPMPLPVNNRKLPRTLQTWFAICDSSERCHTIKCASSMGYDHGERMSNQNCIPNIS